MRRQWKAANVGQVFSVAARLRHAIQATRRQLVSIVVDDVATVEDAEETDEEEEECSLFDPKDKHMI